MTIATMTQQWPDQREFPEDPSERALLDLYRHPEQTLRIGLIMAPSGALVGPDGSSRSLSGPADLRVLRTLRAAADVVVVGAGTARLEEYKATLVRPEMQALREAAGLTPQPQLVIVTRSQALPAAINPGEVIIAVPEGETVHPEWHDHTIVFHSPRNLAFQLRRWGKGRVLCEGGPKVEAMFAQARAIDEWCLTTALSAVEPSEDVAHLTPLPHDATLVHRLVAPGMFMERWVLPR